MRFHHGRVTRLEGKRRGRLDITHYLPLVRYPWDQETPEAYRLRVRCPCGVVGCPELRIGLYLPEKAPSAEAWAAEVEGRWLR